MPCDGEYLNADQREIELSRMFCLLEELDGKEEIDKNHWSGYHPRAYGNRSESLNSVASLLCERLRGIDVSRYSLELQMWWRDHKIADRKRLEEEISKKKENEDRKLALSNLSDYERRILGLDNGK
jgi:LPS O-antigen subunit length determinant protein (WzzB/FepE family)